MSKNISITSRLYPEASEHFVAKMASRVSLHVALCQYPNLLTAIKLKILMMRKNIHVIKAIQFRIPVTLPVFSSRSHS